MASTAVVDFDEEGEPRRRDPEALMFLRAFAREGGSVVGSAHPTKSGSARLVGWALPTVFYSAKTGELTLPARHI